MMRAIQTVWRACHGVLSVSCSSAPRWAGSGKGMRRARGSIAWDRTCCIARRSINGYKWPNGLLLEASTPDRNRTAQLASDGAANPLAHAGARRVAGWREDSQAGPLAVRGSQAVVVSCEAAEALWGRAVVRGRVAWVDDAG